MRAFIALDTSDEFRHECADLARQLAATVDARFVPRANYHLTLAFLGDIGDSQARDAMDAMDEVFADDALVTVPALVPNGLGSFGKPSDATLWLGFRRDPALMDCARNLRKALDAHDLAYDAKAFLPHLTLARRARIPRSALPELVFPQASVAAALTLYRSELSRDGAQYKELYRLPLGEVGA
jgi:2'-5' RNA ligase